MLGIWAIAYKFEENKAHLLETGGLAIGEHQLDMGVRQYLKSAGDHSHMNDPGRSH